MTQEQRESIFYTIVCQKGIANNELLELSDTELLKALEEETAKTMEMFWELVHENKKLKTIVNEFETGYFTLD